jgi:predicted  nucleic acid-binding Zn-ribbon protein
MKNMIENLWALQTFQLTGAKAAPNRSEQIEALRSEIPDSLLRTFDRFVARKKKSVATVRQGVCGECHLQIAVGILGSLAFGHGVEQCGNCGRFLYLPEATSRQLLTQCVIG